MTERRAVEVLEGRQAFIYALKPGETAAPAWFGGIIIVHPERAPVWLHEVNGRWISDPITIT